MKGSLLDLPSDVWALITPNLLAGNIINLLSVGSPLLAAKVSAGVQLFEVTRSTGFLDCTRILRASGSFKSIDKLVISSLGCVQLPKWDPCWELAPSNLKHLKLDFVHSFRLFFACTHNPSETLPNLTELHVAEELKGMRDFKFSLRTLPPNLQVLKLGRSHAYSFPASDLDVLPRNLTCCSISTLATGRAPKGDNFPQQLSTVRFTFAAGTIFDPFLLPATVTDIALVWELGGPLLQVERWRTSFPFLTRFELVTNLRSAYSVKTLNHIVPTTDDWSNCNSWGNEHDGSHDIVARNGPNILKLPRHVDVPEELWKHFTKIESFLAGYVLGKPYTNSLPPNVTELKVTSISASLLPPRLKTLHANHLLYAPDEYYIPPSLTSLTLTQGALSASLIALLPSGLTHLHATINDAPLWGSLCARLHSLVTLSLAGIRRFPFSQLPPSLTHLTLRTNEFSDIPALRQLKSLKSLSIHPSGRTAIPAEILHHLPPALEQFHSLRVSRPLRRADILALPPSLRSLYIENTTFSWREFSDPLRNSGSSISPNEENRLTSSSSSLEPHRDSTTSLSDMAFPPYITSLHLPELPLSIEETLRLLPKTISTLTGSPALVAAYYGALPEIVSDHAITQMYGSVGRQPSI